MGGGEVVKIISTWWQGPTKTCLLTGPFKRKSPSWVLSPNCRHLQICAGFNSLTHWPLGTLGENLCCVWELWLSSDFKMGSDMSRMPCLLMFVLKKTSLQALSLTSNGWCMVYGLLGLSCVFFLQYIDIHRARKKLCLEQVKLWCPLSQNNFEPTTTIQVYRRARGGSKHVSKSFHWKIIQILTPPLFVGWVVGLAFETLALV